MTHQEDVTPAKEKMLEDWLNGRPEQIKELAKKYPPWATFVHKGHPETATYRPIAYAEDGTIRCHKTDFLGFEIEVFGMKPEDLELTND